MLRTSDIVTMLDFLIPKSSVEKPSLDKVSVFYNDTLVTLQVEIHNILNLFEFSFMCNFLCKYKRYPHSI